MSIASTHNLGSAPSKLTVTHEACYVVGVDIGGTNLRLVLADSQGAIKDKWVSSTVGVIGPEPIVRLMQDGVRDLLARQPIQHRLVSIAAGAPGITDVDAGVVLVTSYLGGWRDVPLRSMLEDAFHVPAAVENDVNLAALGERYAGAAKEAQDFAFLAIGTGIGAGIMLHGKLFHGAGWAAGEIGYMLVPGAPEIVGPQWEPGALESLIGGEGIRAQWQKRLVNGHAAPSDHLTATAIFDRASQGDPAAQTVLQNTSTALSRAIYNIALVLNCPLFVLGGSVGLHQALYDATKARMAEFNLSPEPTLLRSQLGADAQLTGAVQLALSTAGIFQTPQAS